MYRESVLFEVLLLLKGNCSFFILFFHRETFLFKTMLLLKWNSSLKQLFLVKRILLLSSRCGQAAGRPDFPKPAGRPDYPKPAGRPKVSKPAGRPNWLAGWNQNSERDTGAMYMFQIKHLRKFWSSNLWLYWTFLKNLGTPWYWWYDMTWLIIHVDFWRICKMWNRTTDCSASPYTAHQGTKLQVWDLSSHTSLQSFPPLMIAWHVEDYDACGDEFTNRCITWNKQKHRHMSFLTLLNFVSMLCRQGFQLFHEMCIFTLWPKINNDQIEHDPITAVLVSPTTLIQQRLISAKPFAWL